MAVNLRHRDILQAGISLHLTRAMLTPTRPKALHDQDFYELFWVQNGVVRYHHEGGVDSLAEGDVVFLQPGARHALQGKGDQSLVVSIAIHPDLVAALRARHPALDGQLFWAEKPVLAHRDIRQLATLNHAALQLERSNRDTLAAEAFLLPLCADLIAAAHGLPHDAPDWLLAACVAARAPDVFRDGAAGLVALTGKAHPHVSRTMRRYLGQSPSEYVNMLRMSHAARALVTDAEPINTIAADCGIPNMSHFHKLFRTAHGATPLHYRQKFQRQIVQPE